MKILDRKFSEEKIKNNFSNIVWFYDLWSKLTETKALKKVIELAEIKNGEKVLEIAVGTGNLFKKIIEINSEGENEGVDISPAMLKKARKKLKEYKNYNLKEGNAYDLSYENNYFDVIINTYMLDLLPKEDFEVILNELYRVLKPGGRIIISSMSFGEKWYNKIWYYISKFLPKLMVGCRPICLKKYIKNSNFKELSSIQISQNTFPTEIVIAKKQ